MELFGDEDAWQSRAGYWSLILAEYRLRNVRRVASRLFEAHDATMRDLRERRIAYLDAVKAHPEARDYIYEGHDAADDELAHADEEVQLLLNGSLVAYGFSLLESTLKGCAEEAAAVRGTPAPSNVRGAKIEGWLAVLRDKYWLSVDWDPRSYGLVPWRQLRNEYVHELEDGIVRASASPGADMVRDGRHLQAFFDLIEEGLEAVDRAMMGLRG